MNDNLSRRAQNALRAVEQMPHYTELERNCIRVAVSRTTLSAGQISRGPTIWAYFFSGALSLVLVWLFIGPAWVSLLDRLAALLP